MTSEVFVTYHAKELFDRLTPQERAALMRLASASGSLAETKMVDPSGKFVSRLGRDKRVYWERTSDGRIVILSVVAYSSAA
jgi:hypothetical protein